MMRRVLIVFCSSFLVGACASKTSLNGGGPSPQALATNTVSAPKKEAATKFYFAEVQILSETSPEGDCPESFRMNENLHQEPRVKLDELGELDSQDALDFKYFAAQVNLELMGFDSSKYSFSVIDGVVPKSIPFGLKLRRTPGQVLELKFLSEVLSMKLLSTPVYTLSAVEKRGPCTIKHNINIFAERVGYFKKKTR